MTHEQIIPHENLQKIEGINRNKTGEFGEHNNNKRVYLKHFLSTNLKENVLWKQNSPK